ncbi:MAG: peptidoglycan DD-metalloendopeptidase family protein [Gammaproteobacteria bacterium]|nr:peptidoglycan DD-metalloendopeptidase family protein [Gammaproteobacteria bacterium]MBI5617346.1 peptidoglycan DD-metalloendopeptidase family protein [Gammaproteobacteria bacterium]
MITRAMRHVVWMVAALSLLGGCSNTRRAPVVEGSATAGSPEAAKPKPRAAPPRDEVETAPRTYRVKQGDTLYTIAWRFGIDHRQIMAWNRISNPDRILVGQTLALTPPGGAKSGTSQTVARPATQAVKPARPEADTPDRIPARTAAATAPATAKPAPASSGDEFEWRWPAEGAVSRSVSASGAEGVDIRAQRGAPVLAAAAGKVVYSGSGLRGYGQLIIIQHNDAFLSAYAHNDQLLVTEGANVRAGQKIAGMGDSEAREVMLHFEIRRNGKAVEPTQYLPKR